MLAETLAVPGSQTGTEGVEYLAQLRATLNLLPAYAWYAAPSGALTFVNKRTANYLCLPEDHPLNFGIDIGARWDDWVPLLHPDDREESRNYWSHHLRAGEAGEHSYRVRNAQGDYRWFLARFEPLRANDGTTLLWLGATLDVEDLKRAEQSLREGEHKLRQIIETVPGLLWVMGHEGETTQVNQRVLDYTGKRFEDLLCGGWKGNLHPDDAPETETAFYRAVQTGTSHESVHRIRRADGEYYWHHSRAEPLRDQEGRVVEWYGLSIDIDDRMKAQEALRSSEYNLQKIIETVPGLLWSTGPDGEPIHVNQRMLDYSDMSFEDFKHRGWKAFVHPSDYPGVEEAYYRAIKTGTSYEGSMRLRRSDGAFRWHHARCEPLHNQQGQIVQWYGLSVDIDERKKAEDLLRRSETKFRDYAETASDWFWEIGPDYKFTVLTENAFGGSRVADRIGTACWDHALDLETEPEKWRLVRENLDSRKPFRDFVYCALASNGSPIYVRVSGKPMLDADGRFCGYRGTSTDVTALIRAQEEHERLRRLESDLAHMNRLSMMGELAASLAHEIAQPIATARNNVRAALNFSDRSPIDMGEVREALTSVVDDVDRAGAILDRIRDHIKKAPPRKERVDLNKAITDVVALAQGEIVKNEVSVRARLAEGLSDVEADRVQLQQVILNLILNAVEAMGSIEEGARQLSITTKQHRAGGVLVAVCDSGPGIDPEHFERVFDAFYTTKSSGTGMGLSICRSIIGAHGGQLWASANIPRGAVFQFTLPNPEDKTS